MLANSPQLLSVTPAVTRCTLSEEKCADISVHVHLAAAAHVPGDTKESTVM